MNEEKIVVEFDYNKAQLEEIKETVSSVDRNSKDDVEESVKILVKARGIIQKQGKGYRDYHTAFNKTVLTKEKEFVSILEPLELELKDVLAEMKNVEIMEARKELLQMKKDQLCLLDKVSETSDEFILSLDDVAWVEYFNTKTSENKAIKEKELQDAEFEANREEREKKIAEQARLEGIDEADRVAKEEANKKANDELFAKKKAEAELKAKQSDAKYQEFLKSIDFDSVTDREVVKDGVTKVYRLIAVYEG
jgi:hypothetical protein